MKIRHCPGCAQLVHFEQSTPIQRCWNCSQVTDFSQLKILEERLALWFLRGANSVFSTIPSCSRLAHTGKIALLVAMPAATVMLLISNSFDIRIVYDLTTPFSRP